MDSYIEDRIQLERWGLESWNELERETAYWCCLRCLCCLYNCGRVGKVNPSVTPAYSSIANTQPPPSV